MNYIIYRMQLAWHLLVGFRQICFCGTPNSERFALHSACGYWLIYFVLSLQQSVLLPRFASRCSSAMLMFMASDLIITGVGVTGQ